MTRRAHRNSLYPAPPGPESDKDRQELPEETATNRPAARIDSIYARVIGGRIPFLISIRSEP